MYFTGLKSSNFLKLLPSLAELKKFFRIKEEVFLRSTKCTWSCNFLKTAIQPRYNTIWHWRATTVGAFNKKMQMDTLFRSALFLLHYVKSFQIRRSFWSVFSHIQTEYGEIRSISPYSVHRVKIPGKIQSAECAHAQYKISKPSFKGVFTSCTAKGQLLYVQLLRNSVKEGKEMENDFLNTTKLNVNLKNYTNINLFYNYERKYSISFTESQREIMF